MRWVIHVLDRLECFIFGHTPVNDEEPVVPNFCTVCGKDLLPRRVT